MHTTLCWSTVSENRNKVLSLFLLFCSFHRSETRPLDFQCLTKISVTVPLAFFSGLDGMPTTLIVPYESRYITSSKSVHASAPKVNNWVTNYVTTSDDSASLFAQHPEILYFTIAYYWKHFAQKQLRDLDSVFRNTDRLCLLRLEIQFESFFHYLSYIM